MNFLRLQLKFKNNLSLTIYAVAILFNLSFSVFQVKSIIMQIKNFYIYYMLSLYKHVYYTHAIFHCIYLSIDLYIL